MKHISGLIDYLLDLATKCESVFGTSGIAEILAFAYNVCREGCAIEASPTQQFPENDHKVMGGTRVRLCPQIVTSQMNCEIFNSDEGYRNLPMRLFNKALEIRDKLKRVTSRELGLNVVLTGSVFYLSSKRLPNFIDNMKIIPEIEIFEWVMLSIQQKQKINLPPNMSMRREFKLTTERQSEFTSRAGMDEEILAAILLFMHEGKSADVDVTARAVMDYCKRTLHPHCYQFVCMLPAIATEAKTIITMCRQLTTHVAMDKYRSGEGLTLPRPQSTVVMTYKFEKFVPLTELPEDALYFMFIPTGSAKFVYNRGDFKLDTNYVSRDCDTFFAALRRQLSPHETILGFCDNTQIFCIKFEGPYATWEERITMVRNVASIIPNCWHDVTTEAAIRQFAARRSRETRLGQCIVFVRKYDNNNMYKLMPRSRKRRLNE